MPAGALRYPNSIGTLAAAVIVACLLLPLNSFAEDKTAELYAGPLSVVVETVVDRSKHADEGPSRQRFRGETNAGKGKKSTTEINEENPLNSPS